MAPAAANSAQKVLPTVDEALLKPYMAAGGLPENGSVKVYFNAEGEPAVPGKEGAVHKLKQVSYQLFAEAGVAVVAFNSPKTLHCMSPGLVMETMLILEHMRRDSAVRAVVWTGTGTKAFCSGAAMGGDQSYGVDQDVVKAYDKRGLVNDDIACTKLTKAFWDFPKPMIMAINGLAVGGGANMALANYGDVVFCSTNSKFMYPFARLGLTPELGSSQLIPFVVGMSKGKEMMFGADWFSAEEAVNWRLASAVCAPEELLPKAMAFAIKAAAVHPETARLIKKVMNSTLREKLDEVMKRENAVIMEAIDKSGSFLKGRSKM
mmetsp:Transcript_22227/g.48579  ORF Transcript_22227/g.48579 Transcript_22227/m.48579 type:complete len:320 (+) Transcript_22227:112-1071(+)